MKFERDLIRSVAEPIVLKLVAERAMYGYEIIKVVNERTNQAFEWKEGTLYPCLHRLESQGLIESEWMTAESGKDRKYYKITRKGRARLKEKLSEWSAFSTAMESLFANIIGGQRYADEYTG
ncbi:MAG: helix-turn-helix transcriptional regulator [Verrucomicrobiales bacterium]